MAGGYKDVVLTEGFRRLSNLFTPGAPLRHGHLLQGLKEKKSPQKCIVESKTR